MKVVDRNEILAEIGTLLQQQSQTLNARHRCVAKHTIDFGWCWIAITRLGRWKSWHALSLANFAGDRHSCVPEDCQLVFTDYTPLAAMSPFAVATEIAGYARP